MSRKPRDYKEEYRRRIKRGRLRGLSTSQARGHRLANERAASKRLPKPIGEEQLQIALQELRKQGSLTKAAKSLRISPERLSRVAQEKGLIERKGRRWGISQDLLRQFKIYSENMPRWVALELGPETSKASKYLNALKQFLPTNRISLLNQFEDEGVTDHKGKFHPFETDPNLLHRLIPAGNRSFENFYNIQI